MRTSALTAIGLALLASCGQKPEANSSASTGGGQTPDSAVATAPAPAAPTAVAPPDTGRIQPQPSAPAASPSQPPKVTPAARPPSISNPVRPQPVTTEPKAPASPPPADPYHPAPRDTLDNDTYQGWKQFELNCSRCHGEYAVGTTFAPALVVSLKAGGPIPTKEVFIATVCAGRPDKGMPSWCTLGLEMGKIEQIYLYVKGRADGKIAAGRPALRE